MPNAALLEKYRAKRKMEARKRRWRKCERAKMDVRVRDAEQIAGWGLPPRQPTEYWGDFD